MSRDRTFQVFFFASGCAGLMYQVVWTRQAGLTLGNTTAAIGTVVAVFMGGLALGSALAGRWAARRAPRPGDLLRAYAILEACIGAFGLAVPFLFRAIEPVLRLTYDSAPTVFGAARVVLSALVLLAPATLMGATLPVLVQYFAREASGTARAAGRLYAINTTGAAFGTALAGLLLLPRFGQTVTTIVAAAINLSVGAAAFHLARGAASETAPEPGAAAVPAPGVRLVFVLYGLSGFTALLYEVAWTRALTLVMGSTTYAFTLILLAFIGGLALGAAVSARYADRMADPARLFVTVQMLIAGASVGLFFFLRSLPETLLGIYDAFQHSFAALKAAEFAIICVFILVPTMLMGALLPVACRMIGGGERSAGRAIGRLYAWNTVGCILGSAGASFALIPLIGLDWTLRTGILLNVAIALIAGALSAKPTAVVAAALAVAAIALPRWHANSMSLGAYIYGPNIVREARESGRDLDQMIALQEKPIASYWDSYALVTVHRVRGTHLALRINGKTDASTGILDQATQILASAIPMAIHPEPKSVLVIGLGSGVTLANVVAYPGVKADCVELCPAVVAAGGHFAPVTDNVLQHPDVRVIVNDARTHLQYTRDTYDVIASEPSNLWLSGMATLFTREYFQVAKSHLRPRGMMAQWIHAYRMSERDFRAVVRTFADVFPHVQLWETHPAGDYLFLGWLEKPRIDLDQVARRLASLKATEERKQAGLGGPAPFMGHFVAGDAGLRKVSGGVPLITDDHCWIEYTAPRAMYVDERYLIAKALDEHRVAPMDEIVGGTKEMQSLVQRRVKARKFLSRVAVMDPTQGDTRQLRAYLNAALEDGLDDPVIEVIAEGQILAALTFADIMKRQGRVADTLRALAVVPPLSPHFADACTQAGHIYADGNRMDLAATAFREAWKAQPGHVKAGTAHAECLIAEGKPLEALPVIERVLKEMPTDTDARVTYARALWKAGREPEARAELDRIAAAHPEHKGATELRTDLDKK